MHKCAKLGDLAGCKRLMACTDKRYRTLMRYSRVFLVNLRDKAYSTTFMHSAAAGGSVEVVDYLAGLGALVNVVDVTGDTPLHHAVRGGDGNRAVVERLLEHVAPDVQVG